MTKKGVCVFFVSCISLFFSMHASERIVEIESARTTEYVKTEPLKPEDKPGEIIRFSGTVVIVVTEGDSVSRIGADEIVYDKNRDTLEARGHVTYKHTTGGSSAEEFIGEALLFNIKKQEGVFLDGKVFQNSGTADRDPYIIRAVVTGRDTTSTIAFRKGILTTCDEIEPHWTIRASRIWLLPGNEISILNGLFYIGSLPIFYIPFFYYPADEMIVHPVFGFRNREGYFVQTTSYLFGRKPLPPKSENGAGTSFSSFIQGDTLKEQKRNGLFLQNLESNAKDVDPDYLKLMADAYSSLGGQIGLDGSYSTESFFKKIAITGLFGFSRTLYPPENAKDLFYSTYDAEGIETYNSGWFYGTELDYRYKGNLSVEMDKKPFRLSLGVPLMSDPYFKADFLDRSEDLNWFKLLMDQDSLAEEDETTSDENTYSWIARGSITPDVSILNPWVKTLSLSSFSGVFTFNSMTNKALIGDQLLYSPERKFFYPENIKPDARLSLSGTLFSSEMGVREKKATTSSANESVDITGIDNPFDAPAAPVTEEESTDTIVENKPTKEDINRFIPSLGSGVLSTLIPPVAAYSINWSADPSFLQDIRYNPLEWETPDDIEWNTFASTYYQIQNKLQLQGQYSWDANFFTASSSLNYSGIHQEHPYLSEAVPQFNTIQQRDTVKLNDMKANVYTISTVDAIQLMPFNRHFLLKPMALGWNLDADLIRTVFDGTVEDSNWKTEKFKWEKEYFETHTATAVAGVSLANYEQKVTVMSNLPPLLDAYTGTSSFSWFFGSLNMSTKLFEKEDAEKKWFWDPFKLTLNWKLPAGITLGQEYTYDIEEETPSRFHATATYSSFTAYYTITNTIPYRLDTLTGWVSDGTEPEFIPSATGLTYNNNSKPLKLYQWNDRIFLQMNVASNLLFNLLKPTESNFDFNPSLTLKIYEFLDITFSSNSRNDVIARYYQDWIVLPAPLPGEKNVVVDVFKSFNFFNRQEREQSGFKLKSLNLEVIHYLHDWTMNFKTSLKPELKTTDGFMRYDFIPTITFMVQWKPISDIKTTVKSEDAVFSLNTGSTVTTTDE